MRSGYQNLHTHTTYCDGKLSAEDMIKAALQKGGSSIGFSEHSFVPFDREYSMSLENTPKYIHEINELKAKYEGQIEVYLGIEMDCFTDVLPEGLEYVLGVSHHVEKDGDFITIDGSLKHIERVCTEHFNNDYYAMAEKYYATITNVVQKTKADIVGHFDLIVKRNIDGCLFDEMHPRYIKAALDAMESILEHCNLFEINTGAMYRLGKAEPYPSVYMLKELQKRGGEIILSSDSHSANSLYFKFDEIQELVKSCGFTYIKRLTKDGFINEKL
ncbi:MAG: histidinol-phosphatase [Oscillospiraceae bacterium]|nr:histidinol-phosphatase [Oscillospiraceae bacterium]